MEDRRRKSVMSDKSALAIYGNTSLSTVFRDAAKISKMQPPIHIIIKGSEKCFL